MSSIPLKNVGISRDEYHAMIATARRAPFCSAAGIYRTLRIISSDDRSSAWLIDMRAGAGIAFIPRYPLAAGRLVAELQGVLDDELGADLADGSITDRRGQTEAVSHGPWFFD